MAAKPHDPEERLRNLMDALAESVAEAPDEEILDEARESGKNMSARAERVRNVLRSAVDDHEARARVGRAADAGDSSPGVFARLAALFGGGFAGRVALATIAVLVTSAALFLVWRSVSAPPETAQVRPVESPSQQAEPPAQPPVAAPTTSSAPTTTAPTQPSQTRPTRPNGETPTHGGEPSTPHTRGVGTPQESPVADIKKVYLESVEGAAAGKLREAVRAQLASRGLSVVSSQDDADAMVKFTAAGPDRFKIQMIAVGGISVASTTAVLGAADAKAVEKAAAAFAGAVSAKIASGSPAPGRRPE